MKKKKRYGATPKEQLIASTRDKLHHFIMAQETIRAALARIAAAIQGRDATLAVLDEARRMGVSFAVYSAGGYEYLDRQREQFDECLGESPDGILLSAVSLDGLNDLVALVAIPATAGMKKADLKQLEALLSPVAGACVVRTNSSSAASAGWTALKIQGTGCSVAVVASSTDDGGTNPSTAVNVKRFLPSFSGSSSASTTMISPAENSL